MSKKIYIIAGEESGDFLGGQLMSALNEKVPDIQYFGIGGDKMQAQGLQSLFPMNELSLMGVFEILPKLKHLLGRIDQTVDDIIVSKPDMVLTIDAPDFSFRVHKKVRQALGDKAPKLVHYVAPTVWAWRPGRAKIIAAFLDHLICLFHFEPPYFEKENLPAIAVGHPMMESGLEEATPEQRIRNQTLGIFFGSRNSEVKRLAPILSEALQEIVQARPDIELIVPTLKHLEKEVREVLEPFRVKKHIYVSPENKWSVFKSCDAAIAVSGTVGLELAACNVPHLIAYRMNFLTGLVGKLLIKTRFAHLANIIMNRRIVPEFIQNQCKADLIAKETLKILEDDQVRVAQTNAFDDVRQKIKGKEGAAPSQTAADFILSL